MNSNVLILAVRVCPCRRDCRGRTACKLATLSARGVIDGIGAFSTDQWGTGLKEADDPPNPDHTSTTAIATASQRRTVRLPHVRRSETREI